VRPFWRFAVDLDSNQFQRLAEYEAQGAQAYYTAPRFSDWRRYAGHFQNGEVLENSLLVRPSDVVTAAGPSGKHRVVYDRYHRYVCSEPRPIAETRPEEFVERVAADVRKGGISLSERLRRLVERPSELEPANLRSSRRRLSGLEERAKRPEDAWAARLGLDVWTQGAQLIMVTDATVSVS
jgi:hypothetical protein